MAVASYSPGDVIISDYTLSSPRGSLDLSLMYATIKIFESIFVPNAVLQSDIFDVNDALGNLNIIGDETVTITLGAPGGTMASYTFALDTISNQEAQGSTKSKLWTLHGVGQETMYSKTNFVQKSYDTDISSIVQGGCHGGQRRGEIGMRASDGTAQYGDDPLMEELGFR